MKKLIKYTSIALLISTPIYSISQTLNQTSINKDNNLSNNVYGLDVLMGSENSTAYLPQLKGKKVGVVSNQTGILRTNPNQLNYNNTIHLVDFLLDNGINVAKNLFARTWFSW